MSRGQSHGRRESVERGARVAETGTLVPRARAAVVPKDNQGHGVGIGTVGEESLEQVDEKLGTLGG